MRIESEVDDIVKRVAKESGTSAKVNVPKGWAGKHVIVCLLDEAQQQAARRTEHNDA